MAKQIYYEFDGKEYTFEFTRSAIKRMEERGFDFDKANAAPMTAAYDLFCGALYAHHSALNTKTRDKMFDELTDLNGWTDDFIEMYKDAFEATADGAEEGEKKRTKNW